MAEGRPRMPTDYSTFLEDGAFAIFTFHGVIRRQRHAIRNYTRKHLEVDAFVAILRDLQAHGAPVSLPEIVAATRAAQPLPTRAFAVTLEDAFRNNYTTAAPVFDDLGIPATFYVTTGFIESNSPSWTDMIEYAVEQVGSLHIDASLPAYAGSYETREQKIALLNRIRDGVKADPNVDPYQFAHAVWRQLGVSDMQHDPELDEKLSWSELAELSRHPLFTIGGHGHTHRILEYLEQPELEREIATSVGTLRAKLDLAIEHYSYPEGLRHCYSDRVIAVLRRHHIVCAPSAEHGVNSLGDDLFHLKRVAVV